jgi:hypothetical protein
MKMRIVRWVWAPVGLLLVLPAASVSTSGSFRPVESEKSGSVARSAIRPCIRAGVAISMAASCLRSALRKVGMDTCLMWCLCGLHSAAHMLCVNQSFHAVRSSCSSAVVDREFYSWLAQLELTELLELDS